MIAPTKRLALIASVAAGLLTVTNAEAEPPAAVIPANLAAVDASSKPPRDGRHDFDFWLGEWQVHHRRIKERLANSHEWIEFEGTTSVRPVMGGAGLVDDNTLALPGNAFRSVGLRAYDPKTGDWSIWWLDTRDPSADLDPAVKGHFEKRDRHLLRGGNVQGQTGAHALYLVTHHAYLRQRRTSLFNGRRQDLGDELVHGMDPSEMRWDDSLSQNLILSTYGSGM